MSPRDTRQDHIPLSAGPGQRPMLHRGPRLTGPRCDVLRDCGAGEGLVRDKLGHWVPRVPIAGQSVVRGHTDSVVRAVRKAGWAARDPVTGVLRLTDLGMYVVTRLLGDDAPGVGAGAG